MNAISDTQCEDDRSVRDVQHLPCSIRGERADVYRDRVQRVDRDQAARRPRQAVAEKQAPAAQADGATDLIATRAASTVAAPSFGWPSATKIRRYTGPPVIRRVISDQDWDDRVTGGVAGGKTVAIWHDQSGNRFLIRQGAAGLEFKAFSAADKAYKALDAETTAKMKANASLTPSHLREQATFDKKESPGKGFTVTEFANEPLSLVHHTASTGADANPHLTMENAHVLAIKDLGNPTKRDVASKATEDKSTINDRLLADYKTPAVDNLNFYPAETDAAKADEQVSLHRYVAFIVKALEVSDVPREFGARIATFADEMGINHKLDPAQLFLRVGMDDAALIRAVLVIDNQLPPAHKLAIDAETRLVFSKWWTIVGNPEPVPYLPAPTPKEKEQVNAKPDRKAKKGAVKAEDAVEGERVWVREGNPHDGLGYSVIQTIHTRNHVGKIMKAIRTFTPDVVDPVKAGGKTKK